MSEMLETLSHWVNWGVIGVVTVDVLILLAELGDFFSKPNEHRLHPLSVCLVASAAILPAALASLNGIRFQSECARLADRSAYVQEILAALKDRAASLHLLITETAPAASKGAWTLDAIELAETCARVTLDETAEWSVLYAQELAHA